MLFSKKTVLKTGTHKVTKSTVRLIHATAGLEIAGSGTRETGEKWGSILTTKDGTTVGSWYKSESLALKSFNEITK